MFADCCRNFLFVVCCVLSSLKLLLCRCLVGRVVWRVLFVVVDVAVVCCCCLLSLLDFCCVLLRVDVYCCSCRLLRVFCPWLLSVV